MSLVRKVLRKVRAILYHCYFVFYFTINKAGREYRIGRLQKLRLATRILVNHSKTISFTTKIQHLVLVNEVLSVPKSFEGDVVECGCYNGSMTVSLSLACALTNRRLIICDSFEGLPHPQWIT